MTWPPTSLNDTQLANARVITEVGQRLGASSRDIQIALMTAMQESELLNMQGGDRDSTGLFQQRDAWGSYADRMDPYKSAAMFFQGGQDGQRGLLGFKGRDQMSLTQAAQAVQGSAYPDAYAKWESLAAKYMPDLGAGQSNSATGVSENTGAQPTTPATPTTPAAQPIDVPGAVAGEAATPVGATAATPIGAGTPTPGGAGATAAPTQLQPSQMVLAPTGPNSSGLMSREQFNDLFPEAAATKTFSGALTNASAARRSDVISNAMSYMGTPYSWGGNSRAGVDCSGLVQQVYKSFGVDVPRLSADQIRAGNSVSYSALRPGDLIGWDINSRNNGADHIAIYAGNNQIIEAPRPGLYVRKRTLSEHEMNTALGAHFAQLD